ncbi:DNA alkylation repair protein, partial [Roseobacter sinensis]
QFSSQCQLCLPKDQTQCSWLDSSKAAGVASHLSALKVRNKTCINMNLPPAADIDALQIAIVSRLKALGDGTPYVADANEPDPRYLGYGVRAPEMKRFLASLKPEFADLHTEQKIELATRLIASGYGEQKSVAIALVEKVQEHFTPERFGKLEDLVSGLHG